VICDAFQVVVVPFPFSDSPGHKRRPALVLSARHFNRHGHAVMAMITTRTQPAWPGDTPVSDLRSAGLQVQCSVRLKLFTLDNRLLVRVLGRLAPADARRIRREISRHLPAARVAE
jgi:mRNA interferase MazF